MRRKQYDWQNKCSQNRGGVQPYNVSNIKTSRSGKSVFLSWADPNDTFDESGNLICQWKGTRVVYKTTGYPINQDDGEIAINSEIRNQYSENAFELTNIDKNKNYYFLICPYSTKNVYNVNEANRVMIKNFSIMTVIIDETDSNPETCCSYADDAINMNPGSDEWDNFFGYYPCLFKNGQEVGKLNPTNYELFEDGTEADITNGDEGDVMIAFPRMEIKFNRINNNLYISLTDEPHNPEFSYYAHSRKEISKDKFYVGAYKSSKLSGSNKIRSLSGKSLSYTYYSTIRQYTQLNGTGYDCFAFYQLAFIQVLYLLKYKKLNSNKVIGNGNISSTSNLKNTGNTNKLGLNYGTTENSTTQMKLFGIEDLWGNENCFIDGIRSLKEGLPYEFYGATDSFEDDSSYTIFVSGWSGGSGGYMSKANGTNEGNFFAIEFNGSSTTYYCDNFKPTTYSYFYKRYNDFLFGMGIGKVSSNNLKLYSRLMYL